MKVAILVDGGFYRKVAIARLGHISAGERANELINYCSAHYHKNEKGHKDSADLYRIFYYDCAPISRPIFHPLLKKQVNFGKTDTYQWMNDFLNELKKKRKVALRLGKLNEETANYTIRPDVVKKLCNGSTTMADLTENDFVLNLDQKGVDMKIGLDISSLAYKKQVDKIILISGDSDFVPAAKLARREGIDFVLDPLFQKIKDDLFEHIDGLCTVDSRFRFRQVGADAINAVKKVSS